MVRRDIQIAKTRAYQHQVCAVLLFSTYLVALPPSLPPSLSPQVMLTGATMYALAIGAVSHIITTVVARHSHSRRIERHAEAFIRMHSLPQYLASEVRIIRIVPAWMMVLTSGSGEGPCCVCFLRPPPTRSCRVGSSSAVHCCALLCYAHTGFCRGSSPLPVRAWKRDINVAWFASVSFRRSRPPFALFSDLGELTHRAAL